MNRREVVRSIGLALVVLATPSLVRAQQAGRLPTIGYLSDGSPPASPGNRMIDAFVQRLKELGYVEGKNIAIEYRFADRKPERWPEVAAELVGLKVDVIVTESGQAALNAKKVTQTIPIVMGGSGNPVGMGLVASLERPGGNVTGLTDWSPDMMKNRLQVLAKTVPNMTRVGFLWPGAGSPTTDREWTDADAVARELNLKMHFLQARVAADLPVAFAEAAREQVQGMVIFSMPTLIATAGPQIAELAIANRLPVVSHIPRYPINGGLMSYGPDPFAFFRQAAGYVDRILKGAKPADLPVEGPKNTILVINLKAAKAIDLTISPALLAQASQVIQ
jgi:putative ABC transport system substrate-binding protein